jgi:membrane-bound ClpP family serine protease
MLRLQLIGLALLVCGLLIGGLGWTFAENEVIGCAFALVGLVTLLSGGMLLHNSTS